MTTDSNAGQSSKPRPPHQFQPGQSGNPGGRSKVAQAVKDILAKAAPDGAEELVRLMKGAEKESDRIKAIELVLSHVIGKPAQAVELSGDGLAGLLKRIVTGAPDPEGGDDGA